MPCTKYGFSISCHRFSYIPSISRCLFLLLTWLIVASDSQTPSSQQQAVVCASLLITNFNRAATELSGRTGCEYILQDVVIKNVNVDDLTALNEKLKSIKSIDGSLIIDYFVYSGRVANVSLATIRFPQLSVIRGNEVKYKAPVIITPNSYYPALLIRQFQVSGPSVSVAFPSLRVVRAGDIVITISLQFIYANKISWESFLSDTTKQNLTRSISVSATGTCSKRCDASFNYCFGPADSDCQLRAVGTTGCDSQCIGGCSSPTDATQCFACKERKDIVTNECVAGCPAATDSRGRPRPDGRYTLSDTLCVKQCPPGLLKYGDNCLLKCPIVGEKYTYEKDGECNPCAGSGQCTESIGECYLEKMNVSNGLLTNENIVGFSYCTKIIGDIALVRVALSYDNAVKYLSNVTVIVGVLKVLATPYPNLSFFSNLQSIEARWLIDSVADGGGNDAALSVTDNANLNLLGTRSLRSARGRIKIMNNPLLCTPSAEVIRSQMLAKGIQVNDTASLITISGNKAATSVDCACSPKCKTSPPPTYTSQSCLAPNDPTTCVACASYADTATGECLSEEQCKSPSDRFISDPVKKLCSTCHPECNGCKGPTALDCTSCKNYNRTWNGECVSSCAENEYLQSSTKSCELCHSGCTNGCFGPSNLLCSDRNVPLSPTVGCKPGCSLMLYAKENASLYCQFETCPNGYFFGTNISLVQMPDVEIISPASCFTKSGRKAPSLLKASYCLPCSKNCFSCSSATQCTRCVTGTYEQVVTFGENYQVLDESASKLSRQTVGLSCVNQCLPGYFGESVAGTGRCRKCDDACATCIGAGSSNCTKCRYRVLDESVAPSAWRCVSLCPNDKPYMLQPLCQNDSIATTTPQNCLSYENDILLYNSSLPTMLGHCAAVAAPRTVQLPAIIGGSVAAGLVVLVVVVVLIVVCQLRRRARDKKQTALVMQELEPRLEDGATRVDSMATSYFGSSKPDMANLRLIAESALKKGKVLGRGAFGTVYAGTWQPEAGVRVPVALKVLRRRGPAGFSADSPVGAGQSIAAGETTGKDRDSKAATSGRPMSTSSSSNAIDEVINEARIMCSVRHPCCVRVVGLCLGSEDVILVTQLMQLGSLLDILLQERANLEANGFTERRFGAWHLLTWAHQIADGMNYLESRGIIHRDLAARNVLVRNLTQVRITDFGLAKLLEGQQRVFRPVPGGAGERLPFKWLALESLLMRVFTHKSDVWSFGVTVWELFTFGEPPYGSGIMPDRLISMLEDGNRLMQPPIASIDAYTHLIKCWLRDPDERPTFAELSEHFKAMTNDPGRFLAIPGDTHFREPTGPPVRPPSPHELLADLGVSNMDYGGASAVTSGHFSGEMAGHGSGSRSFGASSSEQREQSKVVDVEEYLPFEPTDGNGDRRSRAHPSFNQRRTPSNANQNQRLVWRNNGYTTDPTSSPKQRGTSNVVIDGGVDGRNILRVPSSSAASHRIAPIHIESMIQEDYMTPTSSSPTQAPLLQSTPRNSTASGVQRVSQPPVGQWRVSGQPPVSSFSIASPMSPFSPMSPMSPMPPTSPSSPTSHRETAI